MVEQARYVLNWRDPRTGEREFSGSSSVSVTRRSGGPSSSPLTTAAPIARHEKTVTVADAVAAWLETKRGTVRPITFLHMHSSPATWSGPFQRARRVVRSFIPAKVRSRRKDRSNFLAGRRCRS